MRQPASTPGSGPSAGPLPSRPFTGAERPLGALRPSSLPLGAEPGREKSGGPLSPAEEPAHQGERGLQGRSTYPPSEGPLYSQQWYRLARVRPHLAAQVRVQRQHWRDQRWYVLSDDASGRTHRINEAAYQFVGRCDGQRTVHEIWSALLESNPQTAPTQDEVLALLGQLGELDLLMAEGLADAAAQQERASANKRERRRAMLNPFSFRLPLADPNERLRRLDSLARKLFSPWAGALWALSMLLGLLLAGVEWPALSAHAQTQFLSSRSLLLVWLIYPAAKAVHELAHALAVRRYGGEVHELGLTLMFLVPAPYVDASAANGMASRVSRAVISSAGIAAELALAVLGLLLWMATTEGWVHDAAFVLAFIGVGSTLLFNGNPLLRFDAYHVLCDLGELPNLAGRSAAWWSARLGRWLLGSSRELPPHAASERGWLMAYAPLSLAWRVLLSVGIVLWLGSHWLLLGLVACAYVGLSLVIKPLHQWARQAMDAAQPGRELSRVRLRLGLAAGGVAAFVGLVPMPFSTVAPAVVWLPEASQLRPQVDGFVAELPVADGQHVQVGDLLLRLHNPELVAAREQFASRLDGLKVEHYQVLMRDPNAAQNLAAEIERLGGEVQRADERLARLEVRAQAAGTLVMPRQQDWLGAYLRQGVTVGHVLAPQALRVRAAVAQADAHLIRSHVRGAEVRLADEPLASHTAHFSGDTPAATRQLPSAALADVGGGPYPADPAGKDGAQVLQPVFLFDLTLPQQPLQRVGGRAWVRFDHGLEPLAVQGWRRAAQLFLQHFSPTA